MTSARPYRASMSSVEAMDILEQGMGTQWDPQVVETFLGIMRPCEARVIHAAS
jgi:HD-GYP domain-containing protein (c-di-GMP phosphodiesterase class II)